MNPNQNIDVVKEIWVIDDDNITQLIAKKMFANFDNRLITRHYTDPILAFKDLVDSHLPAFILLDINMPFLNGWQFLNQMADNLIEVPVHMFTSSIDERDFVRSETYSQVKGYILKPLNAEKIANLFK